MKLEREMQLAKDPKARSELQRGAELVRGTNLRKQVSEELAKIQGKGPDAIATLVSAPDLHPVLGVGGYRSILRAVQLVLCVVNLLDLVWVSRWNLALGIPDQLFSMGYEVLQVAAPLAAEYVTPSSHGCCSFSPAADAKPGPTGWQVRCVPLDTSHVTFSRSPAPQSMHCTHEKPMPVALLHSPTRKESAAAHSRLKHAACTLLPSAEECSPSTGWQVRSAVALQPSSS